MSEFLLNEVCELIVDCPHTTAKDEGEGFPLVRTPNIGKGRLVYDGMHRVCEDVYNKRNARAIPQENDLIFAREATAGNVALIQKGEKVCLGQRTVLIRPNQEIVNPAFLTYFLLAPKQQYNLLSTANGATVAHVNLPTIRNLKIDLPELSTQHRIATILSRYDSLIENYQKQIKLLEEAAQRLYKEWFIDLHFPGHENTKIVDGVPEGWEKKRLSDIANIIMGQSPKSEFYNTEGDGIPFHQGVGSYGYRFVVDNVYSTSFTRIAEPNSILFSVRAPVGRLNITKNKIVIGRGLASINHKMGYQSYLYYLLKEKFFKDNIIGNGAIFASISKDELYNLVFFIPSDEIVKRYDAIANKIDKNIQYVDSQIRLLTEARDRLLPKLMSGEIAV
ncbi:MAG: restriction endonuclease subunit S [Prevotella sp.]|nr:restriction endonuclease subunit S [Prevotella sp.]